jgi:hypothetical protein
MWSEDDWLLLGGLAVLSGILWGREIKDTVVDVIGRGDRLTYTTLDGSGIVGIKNADETITPVDPDDLVAQASAVMGRPISADAYALARMARSEGIDAGELRIHVALNDLADLNDRRGFGWSAADLITYSTDSAARGHFGQQLHRRYASPQDPYQGDIILAEKVLADHAAGVDPTQGAIKFVDKSSFGVQAGTGSYDATVTAWAAEGLAPFNLPGESDDFVVFRRV